MATSLDTRPAGAARTTGAPPGPRGVALVRAFEDFRRNGLPALERLAARYGDVVQVSLLGHRSFLRSFLLSHPDLIQHVLVRNRDNYLKMAGSRNVRRFFGNAMQLNNGDYARQMRRLLAPMFQPDRAARAYTDLIVGQTRGTVAAWEPGVRPALTQELMDLVLDLAVQIHFGSRPGEDTRRMGRLFLAAMSSLSIFMLPDWVPTPGNRRYHERVAALDAEVVRRIRERRRERSESPDLLSTFARLTGEDGRPLSEQQIRDELVTMMSAGYQSVAIALNQTLRLVAEDSSADALLAEEVRAVVGAREPAPEDLARLPYTAKVIKESLRLCPPAGVISRRAETSDALDGWTIPAGSRVFMSAWVMHRDARFYEDPAAFRPERWTPEFERALHPCAYFPFGRGPRGCIGAGLSELIVQLVLLTVVRGWRLEALEATPPGQSAWPSVLKRGGLRVRLHPRPPA
jgi:cytochrome P450